MPSLNIIAIHEVLDVFSVSRQNFHTLLPWSYCFWLFN